MVLKPNFSDQKGVFTQIENMARYFRSIQSHESGDLTYKIQ